MDRLTKAQMEFMNGYVPATIHDIYNYQQGGVAQGNQGNQQMMQMIQTYAQMVAEQSGEDPNKVYEELMGQLQQMKPEQQQAAMQEIVKQVQTVSQQPAMQMGGDPSQMQEAPQQQGGDAEQLIQQVQQMLQQGAQPQEVIAQLLQLQIDPQMVVEIFVQLGMPQEQVVQAVQEVMQQVSGEQEQEVAQEQMQEQGMEEPAPQGIKYGGIAKYPYGGMYGDKKYYGDFLPQDALNNAMTDINMLAGPTAAMANIKPLKGLAAVTGIASGLAGAFQGYRGAANAVFGKKDAGSTPQNPITDAQATNIYNTYGRSDTGTWSKQMMDKYMNPDKDPWASEMQKKYMAGGGEMIKRADGSYSKRGLWDNIRANKGSGKKPTKEMLEQERKIKSKEYGGGIDNPGFNALPEYVQEKIIANMGEGGQKMPAEIARARFAAAGNLDQLEDYGYAYGGYTSAMMMYGGEMDNYEYKDGGYTVRKTNERKGKTHVVTGPDGTKKYFGDPNMGERGKSKNGKDAFYARHAGNLKKNPYFRAYARATWEDGGELSKAQFGIPGNFDFNNPFGMQTPRFGQTANYADARSYLQNNQNPYIDYNKLNNFSIGPGINDNASLSYGDPYVADGVNRQVPKQTTMTPASAYGTGVTPYSKTNQPKTNNKVTRNVSGMQMANNALLGLSAANYALGEDSPRPMSARAVNQQREASMLSNPLNYTGIYTPNVQGGGNDYIPNRYTAIQDYGTRGNVIAKTGGQMNFAAGGQYKVSHDQLLQLLRDGAEIEFL